MEPDFIIAAVLGGVGFMLYLASSLVRPSRSGMELPVLVLIFLIIGAAFLMFFHADDGFPATTVTGLLIAGSALFGLVFNAAVARQDAARLRRERRDDVQRALVAEIKHYKQALDADPLDEAWQTMQPRIAAGYVPFLPSECNDTIFDSVVGDLHVLPKQVIDPVVQYYSQIKAIEAAIADTRTDVFKTGKTAAEKQRRASMYFEYLQMKKRSIGYADEALQAMNATFNNDVSSPGGGRYVL